MEELVAIAKIVKTRGLKGELVADLLTDFPERFGEVDNVTAVGPDGALWFTEVSGASIEIGRAHV